MSPAPGTAPVRALVTSVSSSPDHTFSKPVRTEIHLVAGLGVEGDAHAGAMVQHRPDDDDPQPNLRQVHLMHSELFDEIALQGFSVAAGELGENVTTRGVELLALPRGTRLHLGATAVVEVTGLRTPCSQIDGLRDGLMRVLITRNDDGTVVRRSGVMGVVLTSGTVRADDEIEVELPALPHLPLAPV